MPIHASTIYSERRDTEVEISQLKALLAAAEQKLKDLEEEIAQKEAGKTESTVYDFTDDSEKPSLLEEAARKEPNATVFAWTDDGKIVAVEWEDRMRGVTIECDHDHLTYCGNCDSKELYRTMNKWCR